MKTLTSKANPILKSARKLLTRKGREEAGAFLVPGQKLISEAAAAGYRIGHVFVDAGALMRGEAKPGKYENEIAVNETLFRELAGTVTPQPYVAVVSRTKGDVPCVRPLRALILDRIGDPGNVGAMIRTALAAGMDSVWCLKGTADVFSDKAIRASAGAVFHLAVREGLSAQDCIGDLSAAGVKLYVCSAGGKSLYDIEFTGGFAIVIGSESAGPQTLLLNVADAILGIPMAEVSESLNAAAAAAIVMYEALRQRKGEIV